METGVNLAVEQLLLLQTLDYITMRLERTINVVSVFACLYFCPNLQ